ASVSAPVAPGHTQTRRHGMSGTTSRWRSRTPDGVSPGAVPAIRLESVVKQYGSGASAVVALRGIDLALERGSFTAVMGPSGSGKSTFLHTAAGLDTPTSGAVWIGDTDISRMRANRLAKFRR